MISLVEYNLFSFPYSFAMLPNELPTLKSFSLVMLLKELLYNIYRLKMLIGNPVRLFKNMMEIVFR